MSERTFYPTPQVLNTQRNPAKSLATLKIQLVSIRRKMKPWGVFWEFRDGSNDVRFPRGILKMHSQDCWLFFPFPLTESTSNSRAVFFAGATRMLLLLLPRLEQRCHCSAYSSLLCLLASHWSKQAPAIYSHYLKVMMRVNKFHAASGANCPEATKKNAAVIRTWAPAITVASSCQCPSITLILFACPPSSLACSSFPRGILVAQTVRWV